MAVVEDENGCGGIISSSPPPLPHLQATSNNFHILETTRMEQLPHQIPNFHQQQQQDVEDPQEEEEDDDPQGRQNNKNDAFPAVVSTAANTNEIPATGSFDCNICLELAQDPVVTLCGHLFCWPCLYKWMQLRSLHRECPVCKASIQSEERVIPLYGRGNVETSTAATATRGTNPVEEEEQESSSSTGGDHMDIPSRPPGQRSDNLTWHGRRFYDPYGIGFIAGAAGPTASARFGNVTFSAGFGLFPSLFRLQFHHGFPDSGTSGMLPYGTFPAGHHHHHHLRPLSPLRPDQQETLLSRLLLFVGGVMILCFLYF